MADVEAMRRALRAVLLFHGGGRWDGNKRLEWVHLTQEEEATTKILCDTVRKALADDDDQVERFRRLELD